MPRLPFKHLAFSLLSAAALLGTPLSSFAQANWPSKPIKLVVPFPPGGAADVIGRYYADQLGKALGQTVLVDNKAGAGTAIAAEYVAKAAPDGHTLSLATSGQLTVLPHLQSKLRFNALTDFQPVSLVAWVHNVVAVNPKLGVNSLEELLAKAKASPGKVSYASCGTGTLCHLSGELLQNLSGTELLHVAYKGSAPAITALLGGEVDVAVDTLTVLAPHIQAGKLKGLVQTAPQRSPLLLGVPSANDVKLPDFVSNGWFGVVLPVGVPKPIVERLQREIQTIASKPQTAKDLQERGISVAHSTPAEFSALIQKDHARWGQVVRAAQLQLDH